MSTLDQALELLEFKSIDDVTTESLKQAFKSVVMKTHPDRGGSPEMFDHLLSAYAYLSKVIKRLSGGRENKQTIYVDDVKEKRDAQFINELNNLVNDIFDNLHLSDINSFNKRFNEEFVKHHHNENERGYEEWLRSSDNDDIINQQTTINESELNTLFEETVKHKKPEPTALILHPSDMAYSSGKSLGVALIQGACESFTSHPDSCPEYTDLKSAYTNDNILFDKIPVYVENNKTLESIMKEREQIYNFNKDSDLEAVFEYEKKKIEEEKLHKQQIAEYFKTTESNKWALHDINSNSKNVEISTSNDNFIINLS